MATIRRIFSVLESLDALGACPTPGSLGLNDVAESAHSRSRQRTVPEAGSTADSTPGSVGINDQSSALSNGPLVLTTGSRSAANTLTPREFMTRYRQLTVRYVCPDTRRHCTIQADVHAYVNQDAALPHRHSDQTEMQALQSAVRQMDRQYRRSQSTPIAAQRSAHNLAIRYAYEGKGLPEDYAVYLAYALSLGRVSPAGLRRYCERLPMLGLDCSGFVNRYFMLTGRLTQQRNISEYQRRGERQRRTSYDEIRPLDVLIWQGKDNEAAGHIAVVDSISRDNRMWVVESSGSKEGLAATEYTVLSVSNGVFQVDRGLNARGNSAAPSSVVIVPVV